MEKKGRGVEMRIDVEMVDPFGSEGRRPPHEAMNLIVLGEEEFCQIRPVLPGDTCDECALCQLVSPCR